MITEENISQFNKCLREIKSLHHDLDELSKLCVYNLSINVRLNVEFECETKPLKGDFSFGFPLEYAVTRKMIQRRLEILTGLAHALSEEMLTDLDSMVNASENCCSWCRYG